MKKIKLKLNAYAIIFVGILLLAFFLRAYKILDVPVLQPDEIVLYNFAKGIIERGAINYFIEPTNLIMPYQGPMIGYVILPAIYLFGKSTLALRFPILFFGMLTVILTYLVTYELYNKKTAIAASFLAAILPANVYFSRVCMEFELVAFFTTLCLLLFSRYRKTGQRIYLYSFGFVAGLGLISRLSFLFFLVAFVVSLKIISPFPKINKPLLKKEKALVLFFFILGAYPLIYFNLNSDFGTLDYMMRSFPTTPPGENLTDFHRNIEKGLTVMLPDFLNGRVWDTSPESSDLWLVFALSLIILLCSDFYEIKRGKFRLGGAHIADFFVFSNLFFIFLQTSTLTLSSLRSSDYILGALFIAIIIARAVYRLVQLTSNHSIFAGIALVSILLFAVYNEYLFFSYLYFEYPKTTLDSEGYMCSNFMKEVSEHIKNMSHTKIWVDFPINEGRLSWYLSEKIGKLADNTLFPRERFIENLDKALKHEDVVYVFSNGSCMATYITEKDFESMFLSRVAELNRSIKLAISINSSTGKNLYRIYEV